MIVPPRGSGAKRGPMASHRTKMVFACGVIELEWKKISPVVTI
jgi:hypothetical protein